MSPCDLGPDDEVMDLFLGDLTPELLEQAKRDLGETEDTRTDGLIRIRDMITDKGDLDCRTDDEFLLRFLRARRFDVGKAYKLLENYLNFKITRPEIHANVWPQRLKFIGEDGVISVPPYKDHHGRRMMIYRIGNWSPSKYKVTELFKTSVVLLELAMLEKAASVVGGVCIFDLGGISLSHAWNITPSVAETVVDLLVRSFPMRIQAIHIVNQPMLWHAIYAMFRPLLDQRMQERIFFHGTDMRSLHEHIRPKSLPRRYGGTRDEFPYAKWIENIEMNPVIIQELRRLGYNLEEN